jgi:hypothetical protein
LNIYNVPNDTASVNDVEVCWWHVVVSNDYMATNLLIQLIYLIDMRCLQPQGSGTVTGVGISNTHKGQVQGVQCQQDLGTAMCVSIDIVTPRLGLAHASITLSWQYRLRIQM